MPSLAGPLFELLPIYGPWLVFALAFLETSFVTGLVVPSGVATSMATALAMEGGIDLVPVVAAAFAGGALGDSVGFWMGRWTGEKILQGQGRWARRIASRREALSALYGRHPIYSVSVARLISFVRTLMPMAAGMSDLTYRRYLPYQLLGLTFWVALYVALGASAFEGWEATVRALGVGGAAAAAAIAFGVWTVIRRRTKSRRRDSDPRDV